MFGSRTAAIRSRQRNAPLHRRDSGLEQLTKDEKLPHCTRIRSSCLDIELTVYSDFDTIEQDWRDFEEHADCTVFQTYDWLAAWQCRVGALAGFVPLVVVGRDHDGRILLILPLMAQTRGLLRRLSWLGSELCDYNAPLLAADFSKRIGPEAFADLWRDVLRLIRKHLPLRFDVIDLEKMPLVVGEQPNPFINLKVIATPNGAHSTQLGDSWEEYYASKRSRSTRQRDRTKLRRLSEHGEIRFWTAEQPDDIERTLDWLLDRKAEALARMGIANVFQRPEYRQFYRDVATRSRRVGLADVSRLEVGSAIATASFGLVFRGCYYYLVASYQSGELSRFGAGNAHLRNLLRRAIERGLHRFDFTIGDEAYKQNWCDVEAKLCDHMAAITLRGRLVVVLFSALRRAKRVIKRNPFLWNAFVRVRAFSRAREGGPSFDGTSTNP